MESFFVRFRNVLVLIAVLLAQTILLAVQVRDLRGPSQPDGRKVLLIRSWAVAAVAPFERITTFFGKGIRGNWANYIDLRHTRQENAELQKEIARLRLEQSEFAEDAIQGRRLQALLAFREQYVTTTVAAQVIGTSGVDTSRVLLIDKGADYGLKPDMAVITPDGIVGKLRDVFPHTSQVLEIDDPSSGAGVILASTRIRAIIRGAADGRVQIGNLTADSRIKPGEVVLTSGGDQVFPRGLKVGTIESIAPDHDRQIYTLIRIRPAANLSQLEEVLVITGTQPELPPQAQQDLATGEATSIEMKAEAKRAADLAAERLPSLNPAPGEAGATADPNAPATAATEPKGPGIVPKPVPTLHPDRYTYGSTPPATSLTPGGGNSSAVPASSTPASSTSGSDDGTPDAATEKTPKPKRSTAPVDPAAAADPSTTPRKPRTPAAPPSPATKEPQL
jgi:rod shape-determining protein MreC